MTEEFRHDLAPSTLSTQAPFQIRTFECRDAPVLAEIYSSSVALRAPGHYTPAQLRA